MKQRSIKRIIHAQKVNMGGHILDQPLPYDNIDQIDPFLLIHHWDHPLRGGQKQKYVGVGPHPHRGFSPVTFVFKGDVHHRDSLNNDAIVKAGGTQWMHAGKGITHSERPSELLASKGGDHEFIQFWINTPSKYKMEKPYYLPLDADDTPEINVNGASISVVAGEFMDLVGPAKIFSPMTLLRGSAQKGHTINLNLPAHFNTLIYLLDGEIKDNGSVIKGRDLIWYKNEAGHILLDTIKDTRFIVLSGEPIDEKVVSYGPFVMNTQTEILEALRDSQMGKMGVLIEDFKSEL